MTSSPRDPAEREPAFEEISPLTEVCGGRYVLLHEIARGDLSIVYRAKPAGAREPLAFKVIQPRFASDEAQVRRFRREAELLGRIEHPNLVRLIEHGRIEDGRDFVAMELLVGRTLAEAMREARRMSPERTCRILRQVARALRATHAAGVIHRDLQPENILLIGPEDGERVKLVDFSAAGDEGAPARRVKRGRSNSGGVHDELGYRAPEQVRKKPPHASMDVFALGVIMYEMLAGEHPFAPPRPGDPPRRGAHTIRTKVFDAPEELLGLVVDCIEPEPGQRPASMDEVLERIDKALLWMGVVPHQITTEVSDEDARTQLYAAADPDRVGDPPRNDTTRDDDDDDGLQGASTERRRQRGHDATEPELEPNADTGPVFEREEDAPSSGSSPRIDPEQLRRDHEDSDERGVVVDTVAWTKPEPSADSIEVQKRQRQGERDSEERSATTERRVSKQPRSTLDAQALPKWMMGLMIFVVAMLAVAVLVVWTR